MALQYVGGYHTGTGTGSSDVTLTSLTGGIASAPAAGDLVIVVTGNSRNTDFGAINTSGYTSLADLYQNSSDDSNLIAGYKIMGVTPDTVVNVTGSGSTSYAAITFVSVWRGVDSTTPIDVTTTTAQASDSSNIDPPSITPVTTGAYVVTGGIASNNSSFTIDTTPTGYTSVTDSNGGSTSNVAGFAGYKAWTSGAENPSACVASVSGSGDSYCAVTIALRPQLATFTVTEILSLTESPTTSVGRFLSIAETLSLTETVNAVKGIIFSISEAIGLVEISAQVFGKWSEIVKAITSFTGTNKSSMAGFTETNKSSSTWTETDKN